MRTPLIATLLACAAWHAAGNAQTQPPAPAVTRLAVHAQGDAPDLVCELRVQPPTAPASVNTDPMELPAEEWMAQAQALPAAAAAPARLPAPPTAAGGMRIAIWGDSHLAANFFTEELARQLKFPADANADLLIPANMGKAGVRLPLRQSCVSPQWKYEPGYLGGSNTSAPGPGLMNMLSEQAGATLAWDVRKPGQPARYQRVGILYQQTAQRIVVGVGIDGGVEQEVVLERAAGSALLELAGDQAISQVKLRLIEGALRLHGLQLTAAVASPYLLDVFGYPGATAAAWRNADLPYLRSWFLQRDYQLVMLEFGTNEGNVKPFDALTYRMNLIAAVRNMRQVFPTTACLLIAPGDRGVLVPRSANLRRRKGAASGKQPRGARAAPTIDLYEYAKIHQQIGRIQAAVAQDAGCGAWSMQDAMGGPGQAYAWARQSPALMARDLIHFTVAGYQTLAQRFARDMGWTAPPGTP